MQRSSGSRFFPLFISFVVIVIIIVAIVSISRAIFSGTQKTDDTPKQDTGRTALLNTGENHSVSLTVRGPIVAQEDFYSYEIAVSPSKRTMDVYSGYLDDVKKSKNLDNNEQAYEQFVYALDKANMMKGTMPSDDAKNDLRGICATGYVYEYAALVDEKPAKHLWASTCSGSKGTLDASVSQLNNLFFAQVPGSNNLIPFNHSSVDIEQLHF